MFLGIKLYINHNIDALCVSTANRTNVIKVARSYLSILVPVSGSKTTASLTDHWKKNTERLRYVTYIYIDFFLAIA